MEEEYFFACPHCWQTIGVLLDLSAGGQQYVQDCEVCCNPLEIVYEVQDGAICAFKVSELGQ